MPFVALVYDNRRRVIKQMPEKHWMAYRTMFRAEEEAEKAKIALSKEKKYAGKFLTSEVRWASALPMDIIN